ncbi:MAG: hypothetical protein M3O34_02210 [Chloroflexota bacterium]|nr:hypothetical protein [Chloroflexota bacterium]
MVQTVAPPDRATRISPEMTLPPASTGPSEASAARPRRSARRAPLYRWLTPAQEARELAEARALGAHAARLPEFIGRTWGDVAPLLVEAWAGRHDELCPERHDPRATFRGVREGWRDAGGAL